METQLDNKASFSQPGNQSVEAYKVWMMEIAERLTTEKKDRINGSRMAIALEGLLERKISQEIIQSPLAMRVTEGLYRLGGQ